MIEAPSPGAFRATLSSAVRGRLSNHEARKSPRPGFRVSCGATAC